MWRDILILRHHYWFSFSLPNIYEHVGISLINHDLFLNILTFQTQIMEVTSNALAKSILFGYFLDMFIIELEPSVIKLRSYECIVMARVLSAPMNKYGVKMVPIYNFSILAKCALVIWFEDWLKIKDIIKLKPFIDFSSIA